MWNGVLVRSMEKMNRNRTLAETRSTLPVEAEAHLPARFRLALGRCSPANHTSDPLLT